MSVHFCNSIDDDDDNNDNNNNNNNNNNNKIQIIYINNPMGVLNT